MNQALLRHSWRLQRGRLAVVSLALLVWGYLQPVIYARFGSQFKALMDSGIIPEQLASLGGGDLFTLPGSLALGFIHPIAICLGGIFAVGFSSGAIAGERERGTLEVVLAKPVSRRSYYLTLLFANLLFIGITLFATLTGSLLGALVSGVLPELPVARLPLLWCNALLLYGAIAAVGLAASVSFDRLAPALGVTMGITLLMYVFEILGSLWPAAKWLQPYSLFHYLQPAEVLNGIAPPSDFVILGGVGIVALGWALVVFPRRDLAAPV